MTLEYICEEVAYQLLHASPMLAGIAIVHFDKQGKADINRIVLKATRGPRRTDGPGGYDVELQVDYLTVKRQTPAQNEVIMGEIERVFSPENLRAAFLAGAGVYPAFSLFSELHFEPGGADERENKEKHRKRQQTFNLIALKKP